MAELSTTAREYEKAINFYKEGLTYDETHLPVRADLFTFNYYTKQEKLSPGPSCSKHG